MGGAAWALFAGVSFGVFQAVNRRANQLIDPYRATFTLLLVAVVGLGVLDMASHPRHGGRHRRFDNGDLGQLSLLPTD